MGASGMVAAVRFSYGWVEQPLPEGCAEPEWDPVLVFGHKLHRPVYSADACAYLFKAGEFKTWSRYPRELGVAVGEKSLMTMEHLASPFIREHPPEPPPDLSTSVLTMEGVARLLKRSSGRAARAYVKRHGIPYAKVGRQYLVRREAIDEFLKSRERGMPAAGGAAVAVDGGTAERLGAVKRAVARHSAEVRHADA